ncbi:MAG: hypothetical protein H6819_04550 [Phycisphaerales bacterium]|nr:hypothetical protein [Phycisphaerales bacterium]MCB9856470.1 hypothetical protein [Phycisphaerales bacterium]MCB9863951.1 hypothetical protein [Phycisphaerales bacterium]
MARSARVQSTEAIKRFRAKLIKFAEEAKAALGDTDAELLRAGTWLRQDRQAYWKMEYRRRAEAFQRAKSALNEKKLYKSATGDRQSSVEEEKAFALAKRRLEEAESKVEAIKAWLRKLEDERFLYKAQSQRMARAAEMDVPRAVAMIDRVLDTLDAYFHESAPSPVTGMSDAFESMARNLDAAARVEAERVDAERRLECAALRRLSPRPAERDAVPPIEEAPPWPGGRRIPPAQLKALAAIEIDHRPPDPADIVILAKRTETAPRIFLERLRTSSAGDSGWYVGPVGVEPTSDDCIAVSVAMLSARREDWAALFNMPFGTLIVENDVGIEYFCDASDAPTQLIVDDDESVADRQTGSESE